MNMSMIYRDNKVCEKIENFSACKVSFFQNVQTKKPAGIIRVLRWLEGSKLYNPLLEKIRRETDPTKRKKMKLELPAISPSGIFSARGEKNLMQPSGFIALDFDNIDPVKAKSVLANLDFVFYAGLSASGRGVWALIPICEPEYHREHFEALRSDFLKYGLSLDVQCSNVSHLRLYSFDPEPVFNPDCKIYTRKIMPAAKEPVLATNSEGEKVDLLCDYLESTQTDITGSYLDWLKIGGVLTSIFGENGRNYFHRISKFHPEYDPVKTDKQYSQCLKAGKPFGIGLLMDVAKQYGVMLKDLKIH